MSVDVNEQDIPETASLADVIRYLNTQRQREAPERTARLVRESIAQASVNAARATQEFITEQQSRKRLVA